MEELDGWSEGLRVLLVDEYQDTNPLQEAIYFSLITTPYLSATIVGDDDQALHRFRGGSVELFTDFADRCLQSTGRQANRIDMVRNFRSYSEIVNFFNCHIASDLEFQPARIVPPKPSVVAVRNSGSIPVLGMFRPDEASLATDLTRFLQALVSRERIPVGNTGQEIRLSQDGALGDVVFLAHSVQEVKYDRYNGSPQERFPGTFRGVMSSNGLRVFNPRGQPLRSIPDVQKLLGLVLLSIDPSNTMINEVMPTNEARYFLDQWRTTAQQFASANPHPNDGRGLKGFIDDWQSVASGDVKSNFREASVWPALELIFKLVSWMPNFQNEPEHQVWLEAITRIVASTGMASPYGMRLLQNTAATDQGVHVTRSRESLIRDALVPIAEDEGPG